VRNGRGVPNQTLSRSSSPTVRQPNAAAERSVLPAST
jgi:hypothetical protein